MKSIAGNIRGIYPMVKTFINHRKSGEQKPLTQIGLPLFQKVQNKHLKRILRIKQKYVAGIFSSGNFWLELKAEQLHVLCDLTEAIEVTLKRYEKCQQGQVSE